MFWISLKISHEIALGIHPAIHLQISPGNCLENFLGNHLGIPFEYSLRICPEIIHEIHPPEITIPMFPSKSFWFFPGIPLELFLGIPLEIYPAVLLGVSISLNCSWLSSWSTFSNFSYEILLASVLDFLLQ